MPEIIFSGGPKTTIRSCLRNLCLGIVFVATSGTIDRATADIISIDEVAGTVTDAGPTPLSVPIADETAALALALNFTGGPLANFAVGPQGTVFLTDPTGSVSDVVSLTIDAIAVPSASVDLLFFSRGAAGFSTAVADAVAPTLIAETGTFQDLTAALFEFDKFGTLTGNTILVRSDEPGPAPEPCTVALFGSALLMIMALGRRRSTWRTK